MSKCITSWTAKPKKSLCPSAQASLIAAAVLLLTCSTQAQNAGYILTDIGQKLGSPSSALAINNSGDVAGYWTVTNGIHAFLFHQGEFKDIGSLSGTNVYALSINDSGQVAGVAGTSGGFEAFIYDNGAISSLGTLGGANSYANVQRWLSTDPLGIRGGLNLYEFVNNNPVTFIDSDGQNPILIALAILLLSQTTSEHSTPPEPYMRPLIIPPGAPTIGAPESSAGTGELLNGLGGSQFVGTGQEREMADWASLTITSAMLLPEAECIDTPSLTIGSGLIGDIRNAEVVRQIAKGESTGALIDELKQLTFQSRSEDLPLGLEHAVISLTDGTRWIVRGGQQGIDFSEFEDFRALITHTHGAPTGPSVNDYFFLANNGQWSSRIVELGNPNVIKFMRGSTINAYK